eukprot:Sdes_comp19801_c0_seq1m11911
MTNKELMMNEGKHRIADVYSSANFDEIITKHLAINLQVDFEKRILTGHVTLSFLILKEDLDHVFLDVKYLNIKSVWETENKKRLEFSIKANSFGDFLRIEFPKQTCGNTILISVEYETTEKCTALQFLEPQQTSEKSHPFLFTQCQAIHCRTMLPCQDTPAVKATYSAEITVPSPLTAVMSAVSTGCVELEKEAALTSERLVVKEPKRKFSFAQKVPVPSYLIALAVGHIESKVLGPRCKVWAESIDLEKAAWEFSETEEFLDIAIDLCGPYEWETYDLLLLPPSFPYGGMENPNISFVTPTLIAGDRSLVAVVAHEITHSWTGNLVTNASWEHFWLNEGFTRYVERLILGKKYGESYRQFHSSLGWTVLQETVQRLGEKSPLTCLVLDSREKIDPDDAFSMIPYEKGFAFLYYLEQLSGSPLNGRSI